MRKIARYAALWDRESTESCTMELTVFKYGRWVLVDSNEQTFQSWGYQNDSFAGVSSQFEKSGVAKYSE